MVDGDFRANPGTDGATLTRCTATVLNDLSVQADCQADCRATAKELAAGFGTGHASMTTQARAFARTAIILGEGIEHASSLCPSDTGIVGAGVSPGHLDTVDGRM